MSKSFSQRWLEIQCSLMPGVNSALFMVPGKENPAMRVEAIIPENLDTCDDLVEIVKYALKKRGRVAIPKATTIAEQSFDIFALPIYIQKNLLGVIVIKIKSLPESQHSIVFNSLKRSAKWWQLESIKNNQDDDFYQHVVGILASCFEQNSYQQGLISMVTELTREFKADRVAFSEFRNHHCHVVALSNSSGFDDRSILVRKIGDAMDEAVEQDCVIVYPDPDSMLIQRAHKELVRKFGTGCLCSIPLVYDQITFGAVTLLRSEDAPFDSKTIDLCQQTLSLMTPFLMLKREEERGLHYKIGIRLVKRLNHLFGFRYLVLKLLTVIVVLLLSLTTMIESSYRVSADAIIEGKVQRVIAAPISGYLLSTSVRAGDTVIQGDVMARLDDSELKLELAKHSGELQKYRREYREAKANRDLVNIRVVSEQINQIKAEIDLTQQQLASISLTAPFDGVIIEGDLSQLLGSPVERGDTLFKIAPLAGYRIILKVDESDISQIKPGQAGKLILSSLSDSVFPLTVERITAVAKADNGANIFRVEASLNNAPELLRPGMEGVGKIDVGRARMIWIWTHEITDWLRLWIWSWWP